MDAYEANESKRHNACLYEGNYKFTIESQNGLTGYHLVSLVDNEKQTLVIGGDFDGSETQEFSIPGVDDIDTTDVPTPSSTLLTVSARPPL